MIREVTEIHTEDSKLKKRQGNEATSGEKQVGVCSHGTQGNLFSLVLAQLTSNCASGPFSLPQDYPLDAEDLRVQQCSAYNDVHILDIILPI